MLTKLDIEIEELSDTIDSMRLIHELLPAFIFYRLINSLNNIVYFYPVFREIYSNVLVSRQNQKIFMELKDNENKKSDKNLKYINCYDYSGKINIYNQLSVSYQAYINFIRASHDSIAAAYISSENETGGNRTSMGKIFRSDKREKEKPIATYINNHLPNYKSWFLEFRKKRDLLKIGNNPALTFIDYEYQPSIGITLGGIDEKSGVETLQVGGNMFMVGDLDNSIRMTNEITQLLITKVS